MATTTQQAIDATLASAGWNTTKTGAATVLLGYAVSDVVAVIGLVIAFCGLGIQWYYRRKQDQREQAEHERRMGLYE
jgi:uncharacterized membrane protein YebE (DUF533 family)